MDAGFMVVNKEVWDATPSEQRDMLIFQTLQQIDQRLCTLEKQSLLHKVCAASGGVIGGIIAVATAKFVSWGS